MSLPNKATFAVFFLSFSFCYLCKNTLLFYKFEEKQ